MVASRMYFNVRSISAWIILCLLGCADQPRVVSIQSLNGGLCLKQTAPGMQEYFQGEGDSSKVDHFFDCMDSTLKLFTDRTQGQSAEYYTRQELQSFAETYFLPMDKPVRGELWDELMFAKTVFLGGDEERLYKTELERLKSLLKNTRLVALDTVDFFPISEFMSKQERERNNGIEKLGSLIRIFFYSGYRVYPLERMKRAARLLSEYYQSDSFSDFLNAFQLGVSLYQLSFQPVGDPVLGRGQVRDLEEMAKEVAKLYRVFKKYMRDDGSIFHGPGLENVYQISQSVLRLLDRTIERRYLYWLKVAKQSRSEALRRAPIALTEVSSAVTELDPMKLPLKVKQETLQGVLEPILIRIAGRKNTSGMSSSDRKRLSLTTSWVKNIRIQIDDWYVAQKYMSGLFSEVGGGTVRSSFAREDLLARLKSQEFIYRYPDEDARLTLERLVQNIPSIFAEEGKIFKFSPQGLKGTLNFQGLAQFHWLNIISENLVSGYAQDPARKDISLTRAELKTVVNHLDAFCKEMLFFDPLGEDVDKKRFMEANLFTPSSTGDHFVDVQELSELFAYLLSGSANGKAVQQEMISVCPFKDLPEYGYPRVELECFNKNFMLNFERYLEYMPNLLSFYKSLTSKEKHIFYEAVQRAGGLYALERPEMSLDDVQVMFVLLQYVETMFIRYDDNESASLDLYESAAAFSNFKTEFRTLKPELADMSDKNLYAVFTYILAKGTTPSTKSQFFTDWLIKSEKHWESQVKANRMQVLKVLESIMGR